MKQLTVLDLLEIDTEDSIGLKLRCICGRRGLIRRIEVPEINRPGLALNGFFYQFSENRIQVFGLGESAFLREVETEEGSDHVMEILKREPPCCIFCNGQEPVKSFYDMAEKTGTPVLQTPMGTSDFTVRLLQILSDVFAPERVLHGVFVEVHGVGVLINGESGVGKSETALELIARGHRLIADDAVLVKRLKGDMIMGSSANQKVGSHMEIRGLGIINVSQVYGAGAIKDQKRVEFVVDLEDWDDSKHYERLGKREDFRNVLGIKIPSIILPIKPGRNIPVIIEAAVLNENIKQRRATNDSDMNKDVIQLLESHTARSLFNIN